MKITFVLLDTGNITSGGLRGIFQHANRLVEKGHEVNIVHPLVPFIPKAKLNGNKIRKQASLAKWQTISLLNNLKKGNKINWFPVKAKLFTIPSCSPNSAWFSEKFMPDADVVFASAWETAAFVNGLSKRKGIKCYFIQHYEIWDVWNDLSLWKKAEEMEPDPNKVVLAMHDIVPTNPKTRALKEQVDATYRMPLNKIVISSWLKELMEEKFREKAEGPCVIGVNFSVYYMEKTAKAGRRVLMPYRGAPWKGAEDGLKALSIVREHFPDVEFAVHGAGANDALPSWVKNYGKVPDDELRRLLSSSDVYVVPSWVEGAQSPPLEAMACGCAVVATNVGGIKDYALPDRDVILAPPRSPQLLAEKIIELLSDEVKRKRIADAGHKQIQQFTWEKAATMLEKALQKIVEEN
jgi:glycosyltransferase involved in cell wall biosynthesis